MQDYKTAIVFSIIFIAILVWHTAENRQLKKQLIAEEADENWVIRLIRFAWLRSIQILIVLMSAAIITLAYQSYLANTQQAIENLQRELLQANAELQTTKNELANQKAVLPDNAKSTDLADSANDPNSINAVFGVPQANDVKQKDMDTLKQRYEELLVSYFFLKKCQHTKPLDYHVINSAMMQDIASVNAPGRLQFDILTAAHGSYNEIYKLTPCEQNGINQLSQNFRQYIENISLRVE